MKKFTVSSIAAIAAVALTALSLVQFASARTEPQAHASATAINVSGKEFSFKLSKKSIARPGTVKFKFKNAGHVKHDFSINHKHTPMISPGKTAFTVMPLRAYSSASARVSPMTPCLAAQYADT